MEVAVKKPRLEIPAWLAVEMGVSAVEAMKAQVVETCGGRWVPQIKRDSIVHVGARK
jgi:hypothetical protein